MTVTPIPTYIVTGFLGSGKTTLLRQLLRDPAYSDTAVIVNEYGEVSLDHDLIAYATERTVVLKGGCVCCTVREDLEITIRELLSQADKGEIPRFRRLVIETTGLANPVPLLFTLQTNPLAASRLELHGVLTTVDAVLASSTLRRHPECEKQIAAADRLVVTKRDLVGGKALAVLMAALKLVNPWAKVTGLNLLKDDSSDLFVRNLHGFSRRYRQPENWVMGRNGFAPGQAVGNADAHHHLGGRTRSFCLTYDEAMDWTAFGIWLTMLLHRHGERVLRVKGLLNVKGLAGPVVIHGVQHIVHPLAHLERWPSEDHRSRIVFIAQDIDPALLEMSWKAFASAATAGVKLRSDINYKPAGSGGVIAGRPIRRATAPAWIKG